jgi:hypothetical protein
VKVQYRPRRQGTGGTGPEVGEVGEPRLPLARPQEPLGVGVEGVRELLHGRGREADRLRAHPGLDEGPGQDDLNRPRALSASYAQPDPDDQVREDELQVVPLIKLQLSKGFDPEVVRRSLRLYGEALRRITEAEADWWHSEILLPALASGMNAAEMLQVQAELGEEFSPLIEQALLAIYRANQEHTWNEILIAEVEDALDRAGLPPEPRRRRARLPADSGSFRTRTTDWG